ncbi:hypothetical protein E4U52_002907 [Claviceps spartinae]|nr:hypothetical protein E4U52_002907 [Claviceps spartinae]
MSRLVAHIASHVRNLHHATKRPQHSRLRIQTEGLSAPHLFQRDKSEGKDVFHPQKLMAAAGEAWAFSLKGFGGRSWLQCHADQHDQRFCMSDESQMYRSCINMAVLILTNQKNMTHCIDCRISQTDMRTDMHERI